MKGVSCVILYMSVHVWVKGVSCVILYMSVHVWVKGVSCVILYMSVHVWVKGVSCIILYMSVHVWVKGVSCVILYMSVHVWVKGVSCVILYMKGVSCVILYMKGVSCQNQFLFIALFLPSFSSFVVLFISSVCLFDGWLEDMGHFGQQIFLSSFLSIFLFLFPNSWHVIHCVSAILFSTLIIAE